jgi:hypothetical protein
MIKPNWPAPSHIIAGVTQRIGGVSEGVYASNNFGLHVGDNAQHVNTNRQQLDALLPAKKHWQWLEQVHGVDVIHAPTGKVDIADASYTHTTQVVCTVLTADCLPILLTDEKGNEVAAIHAGWRSLCKGVIENTIAQFSANPQTLLAWLGPAIGPQHFEVGNDVLQAFRSANCGEQSQAAFIAKNNNKYLCDIYQLAKIRLYSLGVTQIFGGDLCTVSDSDNFYSFRRDNITGRMVSFIYINQ